MLGLSNPSDVIFLVDVSKKMSLEDVEKIKQFLQMTIGDFSIASNKVHAGIVLMGFENNNKRSFLSLKDGSDKDTTMNFIHAITKQAGNSNIKEALETLSSKEFNNHNQRNVPKVLFVLTKENIEELNDPDVKQNLQKLSESPNKVIFVGLGKSFNSNDSPDDYKVISTDSINQLPEVVSKVYKEVATSRGNIAIFVTLKN